MFSFLIIVSVSNRIALYSHVTTRKNHGRRGGKFWLFRNLLSIMIEIYIDFKYNSEWKYKKHTKKKEKRKEITKIIKKRRLIFKYRYHDKRIGLLPSWTDENLWERARCIMSNQNVTASRMRHRLGQKRDSRL